MRLHLRVWALRYWIQIKRNFRLLHIWRSNGQSLFDCCHSTCFHSISGSPCCLGSLSRTCRTLTLHCCWPHKTGACQGFWSGLNAHFCFLLLEIRFLCWRRDSLLQSKTSFLQIHSRPNFFWKFLSWVYLGIPQVVVPLLALRCSSFFQIPPLIFRRSCVLHDSCNLLALSVLVHCRQYRYRTSPFICALGFHLRLSHSSDSLMKCSFLPPRLTLTTQNLVGQEFFLRRVSIDVLVKMTDSIKFQFLLLQVR